MKNLTKIQTFFLELVIVLLFFSFAAAIDLKLFAASNALSRQSQDENAAILTAQTIADRIAAGDALYQPDSLPRTLYYEQDWSETNQPASYQADISVKTKEISTGVLAYYQLDFSRADGTSLYTLDTTKYWRTEEGTE